MSGDSKKTQTQQSQTSPWAAAQPALQGILGQLQGQLGKTGLTGNETGALDTLVSNAGNAGQFAPQIMDYAKSLFAGGGANNQAGNIQSGYDRYVSQTGPLASNTDYDPRNTTGFGDVIDTLKADITQGVNGQFAAAGRDFSGANAQTLGRGLMQGLAPIYQSQFNANRTAQQGAARDLYGASNTNAGLLSGLQQQFLQNQGAGVGAAGAATEAQNAGPNAVLQAEAMRRGIPVQSLGLLAQIGIPIAGLGSQSSGTGTTTSQPSFWQTLAQAGNAFQSFMPKKPIKFG